MTILMPLKSTDRTELECIATLQAYTAQSIQPKDGAGLEKTTTKKKKT